MKYSLDCRHFSGYKPCQYKRSCVDCPHEDIPQHRIIIVSLEALGAVLRTTCLLAPLKRKYPNSHITWLTKSNAEPLLTGNPYIDRILTYSIDTLPLLDHLEFDAAFVVDKSHLAGALGERLKSKQKFGFGLTTTGAIAPFTPESSYQYDVGLDDQLKFFTNQKPETQQITETMGLSWQRDPYILNLSPSEQIEISLRKNKILTDLKVKGIIGYSTGCSVLYPYKKFTVEKSVEIVSAWRKSFPDYAVALFGGKEDQMRNDTIKSAFDHDPHVISTPTDLGLRSGLVWMAIADTMLTGCSLGLHISVALNIPTITWFGVSCSQEIDLYDNGIKLKSYVSCSPCWKKSCDQSVKCYDQVRVNEIIDSTRTLLGQDRTTHE